MTPDIILTESICHKSLDQIARRNWPLRPKRLYARLLDMLNVLALSAQRIKN